MIELDKTDRMILVMGILGTILMMVGKMAGGYIPKFQVTMMVGFYVAFGYFKTREYFQNETKNPTST